MKRQRYPAPRHVSHGMKRSLLLVTILAAAALIAAAYLYLQSRPQSLAELIAAAKRGGKTPLLVAGKTGGDIDVKYTCQGEDVSPPISWKPVPGAAGYALIVYDPDAPRGVFIHWLIYNIPSTVSSLPEGVPPAPLTKLGLQGLNDFHRLGYGGPCPPPGPPHHYHFLLLALDSKLDLRPGATARELLEAARGHVIAYGEAVLTYRRG